MRPGKGGWIVKYYLEIDNPDFLIRIQPSNLVFVLGFIVSLFIYLFS